MRYVLRAIFGIGIAVAVAGLIDLTDILKPIVGGAMIGLGSMGWDDE